MPLQKQPLTWPLTGGLATQVAPLSVQPGSHPRLDNVVQERLNEWRRRNGFTQVSADTLAGFGFVGAASGGTGILAHGSGGASLYMPDLTSSRWKTDATVPPAAVWDRKHAGLRSPDLPPLGQCTVGNLVVTATGTSSTGVFPRIAVSDFAARTATITTIATGVVTSPWRVRCAATATHAVVAVADSAGNLIVYVVDAATGTVTGPTTIKTGMHTTQPYLDAHFYGGSTVTIVCRESGNQIRFIEYNPSTGALATDALLAVNADNCVSLMMDPDASGVRFVGVSNAAPSTRVLRVASGGTITTNDQVEAVAATQIAGCAFVAGADFTILYQTSTTIRQNSKTSGVVGTPHSLAFPLGTTDITLDSQAWRDTTDTASMRFVMGLHSSTTGDAQDTWIECMVTCPSATASDRICSRILPQQAAPPIGLNASLYQVQRLGAGSFRLGLHRQARIAFNGATPSRSHAADAWTQTYVTASNQNTLNIGRPAQIPTATLFPGSKVASSESQSSALLPTDLTAIPRKLSLAAAGPGAGNLSSNVIYTYAAVLETVDKSGAVWRSAPTVFASVTMGATDDQVNIVWTNWTVERDAGVYRVVFYRTAGNGSQLRRIGALDVTFANALQNYTDLAADADILGGDILYTSGELPTAITPAASHLAAFGDRLWLVNRDFPTELWFSKNIRPGVQPEFCDEFVIDIDDDKGDITGLGVMDDKLVVFKRNAIYIVQGGETLGNNGAGQFPVVTRVDGDLGAIVGSPIVSCGSEVYFVADRGIYSIDRAVNVSWVGAEVDQYLHQPLVQTVETVTDGVFVSEANEVRFTTTTYVLVYNRDAKTWVRWTGLSGMTRALVIGGRMVLFRASNGTVWREGDHTQTTDQGTAYSGTIRSAWIRPAGLAGRLRLYKAGIVSTRTVGGGNIVPVLSIYMDNDENAVPQEFGPTSETFGVVPGTSLLVQPFAYPRTQKCQAFALELLFPNDDLTFRLDGWTTVIGIQPGAQKRAAAERWAP